MADTATAKRFTQYARFTGGDGATVRIYIRENKTGAFNLGTTFKEPTKKAVTGCTNKADTKEEAVSEFDKLVALAIAHGWTKKQPKAAKVDAFTADTFPTAKPIVGGKGLAFPKKAKK